jgi:hypothetical protein
MSNQAPAPRLEENQAAAAQTADYQRGYDDTQIAAAVEARLAEAGQPMGEFVPAQPAHLGDAGVRNEQSSRSGGMWGGYRYKGAHRARRDQPSSRDRQALTPGDVALKETLQAVREQVYTDTLAQAAADGASEKAAEVRARSAAQAAVSEYYQDIQNYGAAGKHTATGQARRSGAHVRPTLRRKAAEWLTYSPDEVAAQDQQAVDDFERKHPLTRLGSSSSDVFIPDNVYNKRGRGRQVKESRTERRYQQAVGAVDQTDSFDQGRATVRPESRALAPLAPDTPEGVMVDLIESGARTREEIFNQMYGARTVGGSTVYGGKILSENPGLWRKLSEAGTTNLDNIGPVENNIADQYVARMAPVAVLEEQVTDRFVPSEEIIEGMLFGVDADPAELSEDQRLLVKVIHDRLQDIHGEKRREQVPDSDIERQKLHPELPPDKTDYFRALRTTWRNTREAMKDIKGKTERAVGIVALHGAMWAASTRTTIDSVVRPNHIPEAPRNNRAEINRGSDAWRDPLNPSQPNVESIRVYSPGELVQLASAWAFVRAQMIASGALRGARDWFRPHDMETGERGVSALRLIGAAAVLATAATVSYGYYKANGGHVSFDTVKTDLASITR